MNPKHLRPAVLLDGEFEYELKAGYLVTTLMHEAEECDTLLVAGTRLKGDTWTLVRELARIVREQEGAVVYLDRSDLSPVRSNNFGAVFDFHLKMDVQTCARAMLEALDKVGVPRSVRIVRLGLPSHARGPRSKRAIFGSK